MQFELTTDYLELLRSAIAEKNDHYLNENLNDLYSADIAEIFNQLD